LRKQVCGGSEEMTTVDQPYIVSENKEAAASAI